MTYFVYLKIWFLFLLCCLLSSKNHFNFLGEGDDGEGVYIFDIPKREGFNEFRWDSEKGLGRQENTILKGTSKMYGP